MRRAIFAIIAIAWVLFGARAEAARYYVNGSVGASGTGLSWGEAKKTVQEAVDLTTNTDEVWVAAGTYTADGTNTLVVMKSGVSIYGGFGGTETSLSQRDIAANPTVLDGANICHHVVTGDSLSSGMLDGLTIQRGNSPGPALFSPGQAGGLTLNYCNDTTVSNCVIQCNSGRQAGAVWAENSYVTFDHCTIVNNRSSQGGAGVYASSNGHVYLNNSIAAGNAGMNGGGVYAPAMSNIDANNCIISGNTAMNGGGILAGWQFKIENCVISGNKATQKGGGIYCGCYGFIYYCTIDSNYAVQVGGGYQQAVLDYYPSIVSIFDCIISNNGTQGMHRDYGATMNIAHDLFYNNFLGDVAYDTGAGGPTTTLTGASNIDASLGQHDRDGNPLYDITSVRSGTWSAAPVFDSSTSTTLLACSGANLQAGALAGELINTNLSQPFQCYVMSNTESTITVAGDARGFTNSGNSWMTINYSLSSNSPAVDGGDLQDNVNSDIIGTPRPSGAGYDMGAYEYLAGPSGPMEIVWLDFPWTGAKMGTEAQPFSNIDDAINWVTVGGTIKIKPGSAAVSKRITKQVRIEAPSGGARIGAN